MMMGFNPMKSSNVSWNYSRPDDPSFTLVLVGTVQSIQWVQKRTYSNNPNVPGQPEFWPQGDPKMNLRITLATPEGELRAFTFQPASKAAQMGQKPSVHIELFKAAGGNSMADLIGKTISIETFPANPVTGTSWGPGNPRLFEVKLLEEGPYQLSSPLPEEYKVERLLCNDAVHGGQMQQPVQQAQPMAQPMAQQPVMQAQLQPMPQQPVMQPMQQMPVAQPVMQAQPMQQANVPAGMDPAVANAMQSLGATVYDQSIPF